MADNGNTVDNLQIEIEATSAEAEKKVDALSAALERLKKSTTGFGNISDRIRDIGTASSDSTQKKREALDRATRSLKPKPIDNDTANQISAIDSQSKEVKEKIKDLKKYLSTFNPSSKAYSQINEELEKQKSILDDLIAKRKELSGTLSGKDASKQFGSQWEEIKASLEGTKLGEIIADTASVDEASQKITNLDDAVALLQVRMEGLGKNLNKAFESKNMAQVASYAQQIKTLGEKIEELKKGPKTWEEMKESFSGETLGNILLGTQSVDDAIGKVTNLSDEVSILQVKLDGLREKLSSAFESGNTSQVASYTAQIKKVEEQIEKLKMPPVSWEEMKKGFEGTSIEEIIGETQSVDEAVQKFSELADETTILQTKLDGVSNKLKEAFEKGNISQIASYTAQIQKLNDQIAKLQKAPGDAKDSGTDQIESEESLQNKLTILQRIKSIVESTKPASLTDTEKLIEATSKMDVLQNKADTLKAKIQEALGKGDRGKAIELVGQYQRVADQIDKIGNKSKNLKSIFESLSSPIHRLTSILKNISGFSDIKKFGKSVASSFTSTFKNAIKTVEKWKSAIGRVAFYRVVRGAIKMVTDGFREGTANLYQYSRIVGTEFAPAMDRLATSALYLKNSVGAIAAPLIQAVAPVVDMLVDKFVTLLNVIGKTFAALTGKSVYTQAKKHAVEYADAANSASKATQKFLLGIDELTILDQPSGGGGSAMEDYGSMFEEVEVPTDIADWAAEIRKSIEEGDWRSVGQILAEKLNESVSSLDTRTWGESIGKKINDGLNLAYGFMKTFDFKKLGSKVSDGLNGILNTVDFELLGRTLATKFTAAFDFLLGFLTTLDYSALGNAIGSSLVGAFSEVGEWVASIDWSETANTIYQGLKNAIKGINFSEISSTFFYLWGASLGAKWSFIGSVIKGVVQDIKDYFLQYIEDENGDGKFGGIEIIKGLLKGIWEGIKGIGAWIKENVFTPFIQGFKDAFGIHSPSTVMEEQGGFIVDGLLNGISGAWNSIVDFFGGGLENLKTKFSSGWENVKTTTSEKWENIKSTLGSKWESLKTTASNTFDDIKTTVGEKFGSIQSDSSEKWGNVKSTISNSMSDMNASTVKEMSAIKNSISGTWKEIASSAVNWGKDLTSGLADGIRNGIGKVKSAVSSVAGKVKEFLHFSEPDIGPLSDFHTYMPDMMSLMAKGIRDNTYLAVNAASDLADAMSRTLGNIEPIQPRYTSHENLIPFVSPSYTGESSDTVSVYQQDNQYHDSSEVINAIFAMGQQIVNAINENGDRPINLDMGKVASGVTTMQNRRTKMYGKQL